MLVVLFGADVSAVDKVFKQFDAAGANVKRAYNMVGLRSALSSCPDEYVEVVFLPTAKDKCKDEFRLSMSPAPCRCHAELQGR